MFQRISPRPAQVRGFRAGMTVLCVLGVILLVAVGSSPLLAEPGTVTVWVDPATQTVPVNGTFTVDIVADVGTEMDPTGGLGAYEFDLVYDPSFLEVVSVNDAGDLGKHGRPVPPAWVTDCDGVQRQLLELCDTSTAGRVAFGGYSMDSNECNGDPMPGPTGVVKLAQVTLKAKQAGTTTLNLENALLTDTQANAWPDAEAGRNLNVQGGTVEVEPPPPATEYWFPWYDNIYMTTWVLVGNPATNTAHTEIYVGDMSTPKSTHDIPPGGRVTPQYAGLMDGPVRVVSTNGVKVFTSERVHFADNTSFNEVMGVPTEQLSTEYWFPWYDNIYMTTWVLVGNPSQTETAEVDIYIAGVKRGSYSIPPGGRVTPQYAGLMDGPVRVVSTNGVKVFTSERVHFADNTDFNEVMGVVIP